MGEADRYIEYKHLRKKRFSLGSENNALMALVALNIIFFLLLLTLQVVYFFYQQTAEDYNQSVVQWFQLPASIGKLSERPWTLITYMFSDTSAGLFRAIGNLFWLWTFGNLIQQTTGNEKIVSIYLYGGLAGAVFFIAAHYIFPGFASNVQSTSLTGANAAVMAVAVATTYLDPNFRFFSHIRKGMPLWILLILYIIIDFFGVSSMIVLCAHLGGGIAGLVFVYLLKKGIDGSIWMNQFYHWITNVFTPTKKATKEEIRNKYFYNTGDIKPFSRNANFNQQTIDQILDKINDQGYQSLSEDEKEILKKASEENTDDNDN